MCVAAAGPPVPALACATGVNCRTRAQDRAETADTSVKDVQRVRLRRDYAWGGRSCSYRSAPTSPALSARVPFAVFGRAGHEPKRPYKGAPIAFLRAC